jgi:hypothetical protein
MPACDLHVTALAVAVHENPGYRPVAAGEDAFPILSAVAALRGVPAERLAMREGRGADEDVCARALGALGVPDDTQPLYLVHTGAGPDPYIAFLAKLVQDLDWPGEDTGITHLDEAGGTAVFDLLDWSTGPDGGATVLIADEPPVVDVLAGRRRTVSAAAVRVRRDAGPLRLLGAGEGEPAAAARATHQFEGAGPCDGWLALTRAAQDGRLADGDRVLILANGPRRHGWVLFEVADAQWLRSAVSGTAVSGTAVSGTAGKDTPR